MCACAAQAVSGRLQFKVKKKLAKKKVVVESVRLFTKLSTAPAGAAAREVRQVPLELTLDCEAWSRAVCAYDQVHGKGENNVLYRTHQAVPMSLHLPMCMHAYYHAHAHVHAHHHEHGAHARANADARALAHARSPGGRRCCAKAGHTDRWGRRISAHLA